MYKFTIVCKKKQIEMINKKAAFIFILFANIIVLGHGFVPHRHAVNKVFIISYTHTHTHKHGTANHNHEQETKNDNKYCLLNQIIGVRANTVKQICNQDGSVDIDLNLESFPAIFPSYNFDSILLSVSIDLIPLPINFTYNSYAIGVLGLRAPPAV